MRKLKFKDDEQIEDLSTLTSPSYRRRGLMYVLSSPSGAGKTSISKGLLERDDHLMLSISATTRARRVNEIQDIDYHFVDIPRFQEMINESDFLEYAQVFGNYYGTPKEPVLRALQRGQDVLFDIDWQGTQQLAQIGRQDLVSVFILPPSMKALAERLKNRAQDSENVIALRMSNAEREMSHWAEYDYVIVNEDLDQSIESALAILKAERLKRTRQIGLANFVKNLSHSE